MLLSSYCQCNAWNVCDNVTRTPQNCLIYILLLFIFMVLLLIIVILLIAVIIVNILVFLLHVLTVVIAVNYE